MGSKQSAKAPKGAVTESKTFRDGLIYLYQRADFKKPTWLCRVKVPNGSGYVNRSTGTGDVELKPQANVLAAGFDLGKRHAESSYSAAGQGR